jgi:hypothetical protein
VSENETTLMWRAYREHMSKRADEREKRLLEQLPSIEEFCKKAGVNATNVETTGGKFFRFDVEGVGVVQWWPRPDTVFVQRKDGKQYHHKKRDKSSAVPKILDCLKELSSRTEKVQVPVTWKLLSKNTVDLGTVVPVSLAEAADLVGRCQTALKGSAMASDLAHECFQFYLRYSAQKAKEER